MYGIALEGGGAKGAYHIGAYKALEELGIEIGAITGASIGALNGALLTQGNFEVAYDLWQNQLKISTLFDLDEEKINEIKSGNFHKDNIPYIFNVSKELLNNKGLDTTKIKSLLNDIIDEEKVRNSNIDFGIVTVSLLDMKPLELYKEDIPEGKLVDYLMASANFPAFKIDKMDGKLFIDGGIHDNLPINLLIKKGYKDVIAIRTYGIGRVQKVKEKDVNIIYIEPNEDLGKTLDFDTERAKINIKLGYYDCLKKFKGLKGYKYYCEPYKGEFIYYILDIMTKEKIEKIGHILGYTNIPYERKTFEKILPRLENLMEMKGTNDYQDIIIRMVEFIAEKYKEIERFKIYEFDEFINLVINKFIEKPLKQSIKVPKFIKHSDILSRAVKDDLVIEIFKEILL